MTAEHAKGNLAGKILLSLLLGAAVGVGAHAVFGAAPWLVWTVNKITRPLGTMWLRALIMIVVPLVFASLTLGVANLGDIRKLGRIGLKTLGFFLIITAAATTIGLSVVNTVRPGKGLPEQTREELLAQFGSDAAQMQDTAGAISFGAEMFVNIIPRNPVAAAANGDMLALIFFSLLFGAALGLLPKERARPMVGAIQALADVVVIIIGWVMKLAPIGVFALIFSVTALFGYDIMQKLLWFVVTVVLGLVIHAAVVYPLLIRFVAGLNPFSVLPRIYPVLITAFSTSSSNATLPTTMSVSERELNVPREISGFVLPLGATMNMNGTALFEGVTVLFIAQVFGAGLSLGTQVVVVLMSVVTAVGVAGVPSGAIPLLMMILGIVGLPPEAIALVLGVDRILDMCRTTVNVAGDVTTALVVSRSEGYNLASPVRLPAPVET